MNGPLAGLSVLVTRPAERARGLAAAIERRGGRALRCPALVIEPVAPAAGDRDLPAAPDIMLFTSPSAVDHGVDRLAPQARAAAVTGAVGDGTAAALARRGLTVTITPVGSSDSEGLLAAPALATERVRERIVVIVRGQGGRQLLAQALTERGARVHHLAVYRRRPPAALDTALAASADIVTVTSREALENLLAPLDASQRTRMLSRPVATTGSRVSDAAREAGFRNRIIAAATPGDNDLAEAVVRLSRETRGVSGDA